MRWRDRLDLLLHAPEAGLRMAFQPIVRLDDLTRLGWEALARFPSSVDVQAVESDLDRAMLIGLLDEAGEGWAPDVWFAAAEGEGLGVDLELACLRAALAQLVRVPEGEYLSINVGPELALSDRLPAALCGHDLSRVVLELTEHLAVRDYEALRAAAVGLEAAGGASCVRVRPRLAADDVGAGTASMRHLLELHDVLAFAKLDLSLTRGIDSDPVRQALALGIVAMGKAAGFRVVAEGVETPEQLACLRELGCYSGQGWLFGRPGPLPD